METFANIFVTIYMIIAFFLIVIGIDLKKKSAWILGFYSVISGIVFGLRNVDFQKGVSLNEIRNGLYIGVMLAFLALFSGAMNHFHISRSKKGSLDWLSSEKAKKHPIITKIIKWFI